MPEQQEVSHLEIYKLLIEVKTTLDMALKQRAEDKDRDDTEKADIFKRLGVLENRMAQVVILAVAASIVIPFIVTAAAPRLHFGQAAAVSQER
jgi:hypothetical protein